VLSFTDCGNGIEMTFDGLEKVIAAVGAAIGAALTPIGVIYTASMNKRNRVAEEMLVHLTTENQKLEEKLKEADTAIELTKKDNLRFYQMVLFWFNEAHEMRRAALDARQEAESLAHAGKQPMPQWSDPLLLPKMEEVNRTPELGSV
jgi:hypothetical protein